MPPILAKVGAKYVAGGRVEFRVLGPLEVWEARRPLQLGGRLQRALLAVLLINANREVSPSRLIELLWEGCPPSAAGNELQVYIARLRRLLEPQRSASVPYQVLVRRADGYELRVQPAQLDAFRFERLISVAAQARVHGEWGLVAERLRAALSLWRGPAFAEFASSGFAIGEVARLEELRLEAIENRFEADFRLGRHADVLPELRALVTEHPFRERLCGQLMLALYRSGLQAQASDVYHHTRTRLMDELGMRPSPVLELLFRDILRQAGHLQPGADRAGPSNVPNPLTSFIGRGDDLAQLIRRLEAVRLLTITGVGGIGKTRLAIELARQVSGWFPDGTWLVDISSISDPSLIPAVVAAELKAHEQRGRGLVDTLVSYLRERRALLVLDNCERVLSASADFALTLLTQCKYLTLIATSRERLSIAGEQVWHVSPLDTPEIEAPMAQLAKSESLQLFLDRARLTSPGFRITDSNARSLIRICRGLEGIPLAIELAAAQVATLSINEVEARLGDRMRLLVVSERGRPGRHQTLQAAVEESYVLLDQEEQALFRHLSIFIGGFDMAAVPSVAALDPAVAEQLVKRLIDKSLLLIDGSVRSRLRMLDTVREFAKSRVSADELELVGRRHAEYFSQLVLAHGPVLRSAGAREHVVEIDRDMDDVRAALQWCSTHDRLLLDKLAVGLHSYWTSRCAFREALSWIGLALQQSQSPHRTQLLASIGWMELVCGQLDLGRGHSEQALALAEQVGDDRAKVRALINLSEALGRQGTVGIAADCLHRALQIVEGLQQSHSGSFQDQALLGGVWCMIGAFQIVSGDTDTAAANLIRGTDMARHAGDCFTEALGIAWQSQVALASGELGAAAGLARRALELGIAMDNRFVMLRSIGQLAAVAAAEGAAAKAFQLAAAVDSARGASGAHGFDHVDFWFGPGWNDRMDCMRAAVGPDRAVALWEEGGGRNVYEAAAFAVG